MSATVPLAAGAILNGSLAVDVGYA